MVKFAATFQRACHTVVLCFTLPWLGACSHHSAHTGSPLSYDTEVVLAADAVTTTETIAPYLLGRLAVESQNWARAAQHLPQAVYALAAASHTVPPTLPSSAFAYALAAGDVRTAEELLGGGFLKSPLLMQQLLAFTQAVKAEDWPTAKTHVESLEAHLSNTFALQLLAAYTHVANGDISAEATAKVLEAEEVQAGFEAYKRYHTGLLYAFAGKPIPASMMWQLALVRQPQMLTATILQSNFLERLNATHWAREAQQNYRTAQPTSLLLHDTTDTTLIRQPAGDFAAIHYGIADVLFTFSILLWQDNAAFPAMQVLQLARDIAPNSPVFDYYLGLMAQDQGNHTAAKKAFAAIPQGIFAPAAQTQLAKSYTEENQWPEAKSILQNLAKAYPTEGASAQLHHAHTQYLLHITQGDLAQKADDFKTAVAAYTTALGLMPQLPKHLFGLEQRSNVLFSRAIAHEKQKDFAAMETDLREALTLTPKNAQLLNYLGYMLLEDDARREEAIGYLKTALSITPNDGATLDSMGWALHLNGKHEQAMTFLQRAFKLLPKDPTVMEHIGDVYLALGKPILATHYWQNALNFNPVEHGAIERIQEKLKPQKAR